MFRPCIVVNSIYFDKESLRSNGLIAQYTFLMLLCSLDVAIEVHRRVNLVFRISKCTEDFILIFK